MALTKNKKQSLKFIGSGIAFLVLSFGAFKGLEHAGFRILTTASIPGNLYLKTDAIIEKGLYATFCPPLQTPALQTLAARGGLPVGLNCVSSSDITKPIAALAGDTITLQAEGVSVNGVAIPNTEVLDTDRAGLPFPHIEFGTYTVKPGEAWMISNYAKRSLDSRYFGPVPVSSLTPVKRIL